MTASTGRAATRVWATLFAPRPARRTWTPSPSHRRSRNPSPEPVTITLADVKKGEVIRIGRKGLTGRIWGPRVMEAAPVAEGEEVADAGRMLALHPTWVKAPVYVPLPTSPASRSSGPALHARRAVMDAPAKAAFLSFIDDVHLALHHLAREVLLDADAATIAQAVEVVEDEVRYLAITP